jgi:hypothetical protein
MDNMKLWKSVLVTDPAAVKKITGKTYQGNSPKPYWIIQRATEVFGPVGIGWGVTVKSERFERMSETDVLHVATVSVWYVWEGTRSETFDQMGGTKACYMTSSNKLMVDEDAGKKSVTDAMVKCLSMIGFAGDIFSGMWDDSKYVERAAQETARREAPPFDEEQALIAMREVALTGTEKLKAAYAVMTCTEDQRAAFWKQHGPSLKKAAAAADKKPELSEMATA